MLTLTSALLGVISSIAAELVSLLNKKLFGTPFQGQAALWISVATALLAGLAKALFMSDFTSFTWSEVLSIGTQAFGISQLYFWTIAKWFNLKVEG